MKSEHVIVAILITLITAAALYLSGAMMILFYIIFGETNYQIVLDVKLTPVLNNREEMVDVDVLFDSSLNDVRVPHEVVSWRIYRDNGAYRLFNDDQGSFTLTLDIKVENFSGLLFSRRELIESPTDCSFIIYFTRGDAAENTILQLTVEAEEKIMLQTIRTPKVEKWTYIEKFEV